MLLDQFGQAMKLSDIAEPQTARIALLQNIYIESHMEGITPARASTILREADNGSLTAQHALFDDMLDRDAHLACEFSKRQNALLTLDWSIAPPKDARAAEKDAAAWAEEILRDVVDDFEDVITAMMGAVGHGFAPIELEWEKQAGEYLPKFHPRPQSWFQMDPTRREIRLMDGTGEGAALIPFGWIMHTAGKAKTGYLARLGLCRCLIWPFIYKHYAIGDFAEFLETYGLPIIIGKYYKNATPAEKSSLMRAVTALSHDARAIMPNEMSMEINKITGSGDGDVHLKMVDWAERSQSKAILGQTLSSEASPTGLGSGVSNLHAEVRDDILKSDSRQVAATLTRDLVYPLLALNGKGGDALRRCPRFVFDLGEAEDLKIYAETLPLLAAGGARIPVPWVHEKLRIPQAKDNEAVFGSGIGDQVTGNRGQVSSVSLSSSGIRDQVTGNSLTPDTRHLSPETDAVDALVDAATADWQAQLDPMLAPLQAALDEAAENNETAAEFLARLPALLAQMDPSAMADRLTQAAFIARLAGLAGLENK
ncbi:Mu-like prophage FluMu protein gp29 [Betaproteobacteria bacterium]|nr:Mu-like prophage FluMu protein gp29 [Betaproteobacteria bacterium]